MAGLQEHFKFDYKSILPLTNNIIRGNKFRITVLSELLIRLEYSESGLFEDRPTELVQQRNFPEVKFERKEDSNFLTIETSYFQLTYRKEAPFAGPKMSPDQNLRINLKNTDKFWYFNHPEVRNFGGTAFSLDGADGNVKWKVYGEYCQCGFWARDISVGKCYEVDFWIYENDADVSTQKPVGNIHKVFKGLSELVTDSDAFILTFPKKANAIERIMLIGSVIMIDYRFYEDLACCDCISIL